jgi:hypothetical protein
MERSSGPRKTANLSESVHQQLNMYALAASAVGVGALALAQPSAEAKIVYTRVNKALNYGLTTLDLNNDGTPDFGFCINDFGSEGTTSCVLAHHRGGKAVFGRHPPSPFTQVVFIFPPAAESKRNRIWANAAGAYALPAGYNVGSKLKFTAGAKGMASCFEATSSTCGGNWFNALHRYLGLKFVISGKVHYGWARLNVTWNLSRRSATLTGYAYETIPNKPIITGRTKGPDDASIEEPNAALTMPTPDPATLGALAMGAPGLSIWRREETQELIGE